MLDVQYGGRAGLNEAQAQAAPLLREAGQGEERWLLSLFFERTRTGAPVVFGPETLEVLTKGGGALGTILCSEGTLLKVRREVARSPLAPKERLSLVVPNQTQAAGWEVEEETPLLTWLQDHAPAWGAHVKVLGRSSPAGHQFAVGFGGIGGILRYAWTPEEEEEKEEKRRDDQEQQEKVVEEKEKEEYVW